MSDDVLAAFHPLVRGWFTDRFGAPTAPQRDGWPRIGAGQDVLIAAPTGSGKTLAAFLACLDDLVRRGYEAPLPNHTSILYISPLKALSNDVHRNLEAPLAELAARAALHGDTFPDIRVAVRTGDTPAGERAKMAKKPPHILVTTPESLFILLTTVSGRAALGQLRTIIVDEIHAVAGDKRGAHLALSLERLDRLVKQTTGREPVRVGLSATQRPIERIARLLVGMRRPLPHIVDAGHRREIDLAIEITDDDLGAVASLEQMSRVYDRIAELVTQHRSTILFVNTRRLVERAAAALEQRLGEEHVVAHHGSMSRVLRHNAEQKLKFGQVKCAVATASLELGIDVGAVDLVVQLGSPRSIATLLQRVGRSGHTLGGTPKGRLFALTRDQLMECASLVRGVRRGNLDQIELRDAPLDILAQQMVAICAAEEISEAELVALVKSATPYAALTDERFEQVMEMLSEGVSDRRGRTGAYLHRDRIAGLVRARRSARLAAITSGGAIPDNNNYTVVQWPEETQVGTVDEDFAIDSSAGDVFQLGNTSWKIRRIEAGRVIVEDARGQPPTIPFWFGEAPARTRELSDEVSDLRGEIDRRLATDNADAIAVWLAEETSMPMRAAQQAVAYLAASRVSLGALPRKDLIVAERFFDEAGGMQLVIHAPLGGRINRAWGLALRKKFCVTFDFELQAIATDDGIVISLGQPHSFPLDTVFGYVPSTQAREVLIQALLDRPMFEIRWRWNVTRSLTVLRRRAGKKIPPHLIKMRAADTLSVVFPQALACGENIVGPREIPDHPLVFETIRDCLVEAMDLEGFRGLLEKLERGEIRVIARDTVEPSPLSHELINANPYAFLDDAPLEERRTRAVQLRRGLPAAITTEGVDAVGALDEGAIALAAEEVAPTVRDADELHDALLALWLVPEHLGKSLAMGAEDYFAALVASGRACRLRWNERVAWVATERLGAARAILGEGVECTPMIATPSWAQRPEPDVAINKLVSAHLDHRGPVRTRALATELGLPLTDVLGALLALEGDGAVLRGSFTTTTQLERKTVREALATADDSELLADTEWCNRRVLARIHRLTLAKLRKEIEPVSAAALMRFLLRWQRVAKNTQLITADGLARVVEQLQGFETAAGAWEREILPARCFGYDPQWLDQMCLAGQVVWCRLSPRKVEVVDVEPLTADDAAKLLAALTQVASQRAGLDAFPPLLRDPIMIGERAATRALATMPKATKQRGKLFGGGDRGAAWARASRDDGMSTRGDDIDRDKAVGGDDRGDTWAPSGHDDGMSTRSDGIGRDKPDGGESTRSDGIGRVKPAGDGDRGAAWAPGGRDDGRSTRGDDIVRGKAVGCDDRGDAWARGDRDDCMSRDGGGSPDDDRRDTATVARADRDDDRRCAPDERDRFGHDGRFGAGKSSRFDDDRRGSANDGPDWIAPPVRETTRENSPTTAMTAAVEATLAAALDAGANRQQAAAAIAGMLARKFPALTPLTCARAALDAAFPSSPTRRNAPSRSAPLALMLRRDAGWLRAAAAIATTEEPTQSPVAQRIRDYLQSTGASFLPDLVTAVDISPDAVEDALWELVGAGIATADGFASLRVLVDRKRGEVKSLFDKSMAAAPAPVAPVRKWQEAIKKARNRDRERPAHALRALPTAAGRWSLLPAPKPEQVDAEASARQLLHRYGVVFRDLLSRESSLPPWRDMLVALRRLEARGEIRGGRFVTGFVGEQFAMPEALDELRAVRHAGPAAEVSKVAATDPLNLVGVLSPGPRVPAIVGNAVLYLDGHPVASLEGGQLVMRAPIPPGARVDDDLTYHPPPRPVTAASQAALPL